MERTTRQWNKYRATTVRNESLGRLGLQLSISLLFYVNVLPAVIFIYLSVIFVIPIFVSLIRQHVEYKTEQGAVFNFIKKSEFVEKEKTEELLNRVIAKWLPIVLNDKTVVTNHLSKLEVIVRTNHIYNRVLPFSNKIHIDLSKDDWKTFEDLCHFYLSEKILSAFSHSFRGVIMRRYKIL